MITHTASFSFKPEISDADREAFFKAAKPLSQIEGTLNFRLLRQTSAKNPYHFCFAMEFADQASYDTYSNHPDHNQFVEEQWLTKVDSFQEADFETVEEW